LFSSFGEKIVKCEREKKTQKCAVNKSPRKEIKTLKLQKACGPVLSATLHHPQQVAKSHPSEGTEVRLSGEIIMLITSTRQFKKLKRFISEACSKI